MEIAILVGAIATWGVIHSWLASLAAKRLWGQILGEPGSRAYRLGYNALAAVSFIPILWLTRVLPDRILYFVGAPWRYLMIGGEVVAACLLGLALLATDPLHFIGLRQVMERDSPYGLVTDGFYRWVRHPLYLFGLVILWLTPFMTRNMLTVIIALTVYVFIGAWFEEQRLLREFGDEYRAYQARTPMLMPGLRWRRGTPGESDTSPKG
jgi:protein-S-isoprenylcysteine O-methyltransferase Ste14